MGSTRMAPNFLVETSVRICFSTLFRSFAGHSTAVPNCLKCDLTKTLHELGFERMRMDVAHRVKQAPHLLLSCANNPRVRVPSIRNPERRRQIEIPFPARVPNMHPARTFPHDRP